MSKYQIYTTRSDSDGGWYAEVYERATGKDVYSTRIHQSEQDAETDAKLWIEAAVCFPAQLTSR